MKKLLVATALTAALAAPVHAQDTDGGDSVGRDLVEEGTRLILRGILQELEPAIEDLGRELEGAQQDLRDQLGEMFDELPPSMRGVLQLIDQARYYEAPEVLENGDIIIRRKPDAPPYEAPADMEEEGTDL